MNKVIGVVVLLVFVAGGWYFYTNQGAPSSEVAMDSDPSMEQEIAVHSDEATSEEWGSVKPDTVLVVSESIVGKWQDTTDTKFVREFREGGVAVDMYDNEEVTTGTWKAFTKEKPVEVSFPIEDNAVYIQMTMSGSQAENLNFKLGKLTPEELQLVYMERGGVLTFKSIQ